MVSLSSCIMIWSWLSTLISVLWWEEDETENRELTCSRRQVWQGYYYDVWGASSQQQCGVSLQPFTNIKKLSHEGTYCRLTILFLGGLTQFYFSFNIYSPILNIFCCQHHDFHFSVMLSLCLLPLGHAYSTKCYSALMCVAGVATGFWNYLNQKYWQHSWWLAASA